MASTSKVAHGVEETRRRMDWILNRVKDVPPGTPASDDAVALLRDLRAALDTFDLRSVDIANAAQSAAE